MFVRARLLIVVPVLATLVVLYQAGVFDHFTLERIGELLTGSAWGPVLFCSLFVLGELIAIPSVLFVAAAGLVWPFAPAFAIGMVGSVISATVVFLFYRHVAADWVQDLLPAWLSGWDERLARRGIGWVIVLRLVTFLHPATHPALAVSRVTLPSYVIGTAIGIVPGVALAVSVGEPALRALTGNTGRVLALFAALAAVAWGVRRLRSRTA